MKKEESNFYNEIFEEASIFENIMDQHDVTFSEIASVVKKRKINKVVFAGRGSSDHANKIGAYLFEIYTPMTASIAKPSVITNYQGIVDYSDVLLIATSQSGEAKDVAEVIEHAKKQNGITVSITNNPTSLMGQLGHFNLDLCCGFEKSITAGKSYFAQVSVILGIVRNISESSELLDNTRLIPGVVRESYKYIDQVEKLSEYLADFNRFFVFGRGITSALMEEFELKLQEAATIDATAYGSADYFHGPIANVDSNAAMMLFMVEDSTNTQTINLLNRLREEDGIQPVIVTNQRELIGDNKYTLLINEEFEGILGVYASIVITQFFACVLSLHRGINPDKPKGLSKTTVTY